MAQTEIEAPTGAPSRERRSVNVRKRLVPYGLLASGGSWLAIFFILPVVLMLFTSLKSGGLLAGGFRFDCDLASRGLCWRGLAFGNYTEAISENREFFLRAISYSGVVTVIGLTLAYPLAYWIAFYGGRWKSSLLLLLLLPFFVSFVIRTVQWQFILADSGFVLGTLKSWGILPQDYHVLATNVAVVSGMTYNFLPFTALPLYVALERIDKGLVEAAKDLYASKFQAFRKVVFPLSLPGVFAAVLLTFVPATGDYVDSELLGSNATFVIGQRIQFLFLTQFDYPQASALSITLMIVMVVLVSLYARALGTEDETIAAGAAGA